MKYIHKKSGNVYNKITEALDCTNSRGGHEDGRIVVIYKRIDEDRLYVRDKDEFDTNFEEADDY